MDVMGKTAGIPGGGIVYTGTRDDLQKKLRARDDRITFLEAALREMAEHGCVKVPGWNGCRARAIKALEISASRSR